MEELITLRKDLKIKSKEEVEDAKTNRMNKQKAEALKKILTNIDIQIKYIAELGNNWTMYYLDDEYTYYYDGIYEDVMEVLINRGYGVKRHKLIYRKDVLSIAMSVPFEEVEKEVKEYTKRENRFTLGILLVLSIIPLAIIVCLLSEAFY